MARWAGRLTLLASLAAVTLPARADTPPAATATATATDAMAAGQRAFDAKDYSKAYDLWLGLADKGDDAAAVLVAGMLDQGIGVPRDSAAALRMYRVAAGHGVDTAELDTGILLDSGRGAPRDVAEAATWYARAATHGNRRAQYNLGQLYAAGEGVPLNPAAARVWYNLAARNGIAAAAAKLAPAAAPSPLTLAPELHPAVPRAPAAKEVVTATSAGGVEFVWLAPAQPVPVMFYVEVAAVDGRSTRPVASGYVAETAVALDLGSTAKEYIWRVYVVDQRRQRYVAGGWQRFSVTVPTARHE